MKKHIFCFPSLFFINHSITTKTFHTNIKSFITNELSFTVSQSQLNLLKKGQNISKSFDLTPIFSLSFFAKVVNAAWIIWFGRGRSSRAVRRSVGSKESPYRTAITPNIFSGIYNLNWIPGQSKDTLAFYEIVNRHPDSALRPDVGNAQGRLWKGCHGG